MSFLKNSKRVALSWKDDDQIVKGFYKTYGNVMTTRNGETWYYIDVTLSLADWIQKFWYSEKVKYKEVVFFIRADAPKLTSDIHVRLQFALETDHVCDKDFVCFEANLGPVFDIDKGNPKNTERERIEEYKSFEFSYLHNPNRKPCPPDCSSTIEEDVVKRWERYPYKVMGFLIREYKDGVDTED
jgi:hypothetical protein